MAGAASKLLVAMSKNITISAPEKMQKRIVDCIADYRAQFAIIGKQEREIQAKVSALEKTEGELSARIESLKPKLIVSDNAAMELAAAELRVNAVRKALAEARTLRATAIVDSKPLYMLMLDVSNYWDSQVKALIVQALRPFGITRGVPWTQIRGAECLDQFHAVRKTPHGSFELSGYSVDEVIAYLQRALRGQLVLTKDQPAEENHLDPS
jgi:hypothetical protein